jgi:hypothetical protein
MIRMQVGTGLGEPLVSGYVTSHHLEIKHCPLMQAAGFQQLFFLLQFGAPLFELFPNGVHRAQKLISGLHVMGFRVDGHAIVFFSACAL